jgi:two-component system NtrC family sensor kinase
MKNLLLALLLVTALNLEAQTTKDLPPVYELKTDKPGDYIFDGGYWQVVADINATYNLQQVSSMPFISGKDTSKHFDSATKAFWLRYRVKNTFSRPISIYIPEEMAVGISGYSADRADLYARASNSDRFEHYVTGDKVPWIERTDYKRVTGFYIIIQPGQEYTFYEVALNNTQGLSTPGVMVRVVKSIPDALVAKYETLLSQYKRSTFLFAFGLLAGLICLFFFYTSREKVYLYFGLANLCYGFVRFSNVSVDWFFTDTANIVYFNMAISGIAYYCFGRFALLFYQTGQYYPRWTRFSILLNYLIGLATAIFIINPPLWVSVAAAFIVVLFTCNMFLIVICAIFKNRSDFIYNVITVLPLVLLIIATTALGIISLMTKQDLAAAGTSQIISGAPFGPGFLLIRAQGITRRPVSAPIPCAALHGSFRFIPGVTLP